MPNALTALLFFLSFIFIILYVVFKFKINKEFSFARNFPFEANNSGSAIRVSFLLVLLSSLCSIFFYLNVYNNSFQNSYVFIAMLSCFLISVLFLMLNLVNLINLRLHFILFSLFAAIVTAESIDLGFHAINAFKIDGGLYLCNHYSTFDSLIPIFTMFKKEAHILAKYELFTSRFGGWILHKVGAIPVRRGEADTDAVKAVLRVLKDDKKLLMYPEGTRNREGTQDMAELKTGAARFAIKMKKPIVPMVYFKPTKTCHKNYLYVGEPFTLEEFYGSKSNEDFHAATDIIKKHFDDARAGVNAYVENRKNKKNKKADKDSK